MYATREMVDLRLAEREREIAAVRLARLARAARLCSELAARSLPARLHDALWPRPTRCDGPTGAA